MYGNTHTGIPTRRQTDAFFLTHVRIYMQGQVFSWTPALWVSYRPLVVEQCMDTQAGRHTHTHGGVCRSVSGFRKRAIDVVCGVGGGLPVGGVTE